LHPGETLGDIISKAGYHYLSWSQSRTQALLLVHLWKMQWELKAYISLSLRFCVHLPSQC